MVVKGDDVRARRRKRHPRLLPAVPREVAAAAKALKAQHPGVVGVFWGRGTTGGQRHSADHLCVHVHWKRDMPRGKHIRNPFQGLPTDVIEVGRPRTHALGPTSDVIGRGIIRHGALAALADDGNGTTLGLMSGHVALDVVNHAILRNYVGTATAGTPIQAIDDDGAHHDGRVLRGRLAEGRSIDFAIASFGAGPGVEIDTVHRLLGRPPFEVRTAPLVPGEMLKQFSTAQGRRRSMHGTFDQGSVTEIRVRLPDDSDGEYVDVLAVRPFPGEGPFSIEGDSGSLVMDDADHVVGMILGSSAHGELAYVLPIGTVVDTLDTLRSRFFL